MFRELAVAGERIEALCHLVDGGQQHIDHLQAKTEKAVADFRDLMAAFAAYRAPWLVRAARKLSKISRQAGQ